MYLPFTHDFHQCSTKFDTSPFHPFKKETEPPLPVKDDTILLMCRITLDNVSPLSLGAEQFIHHAPKVYIGAPPNLSQCSDESDRAYSISQR